MPPLFFTWVLVLSHFSRVWLFGTLWTVACLYPLSTGFSRQVYWSGLPCSPPGIFPTQGLNWSLLCLLYCKWIFFTPEPRGKPFFYLHMPKHYAFFQIQCLCHLSTKLSSSPALSSSKLPLPLLDSSLIGWQISYSLWVDIYVHVSLFVLDHKLVSWG